MTEETAESLIKQYLDLDAWISSESKRLDAYFAPYKQKKEVIQDKLLAMLNEQAGEDGKASFATAAGTAYRSTLMSVKVEERDKFIDFALENWDTIGNELLMVTPQKDAVKQYAEAHDGVPPPGLSTSFFTRVNIRRT